MRLDTILFIENQVTENLLYSLCLASNDNEIAVFNYFPLTRIDTFELIFYNKETSHFNHQKVPVPANEYLQIKRFNHCSDVTFNDSLVILSFFNKFVVLSRRANGLVEFSHAFGHTYGSFTDLAMEKEVLFAAKCGYTSSSKSTVACEFDIERGVMIKSGSWAHPYIEFAVFDMNKKWTCYSNGRLIVSNSFDDTIRVISNYREVSKFSLNLDFANPDFKLDSLRNVISEDEPRKWIDALSDANYFKSGRVNFIQVVDDRYLLIRYVRPGESYDNRTYYACAKLKQDFSGIEEFVFKEVQEFRVPKKVNQFITKENFDFITTSALLNISNRDCVLIKAGGKTQKLNDTRANLFKLNQSYLKNFDPVICLYLYNFSFQQR